MPVRRSSTVYWTLLFACCALALAPLWLVHNLPLVDYPNHLARMVIIHELDHSAFFRQFFERAHGFVPNLAMEAIVLPLLRWVNVYVAGKIFVSIAVLLFACGIHLLGRRALGQYNWLAPGTILLFYNSPFFYGFVNYMFGIALLLITYDTWLRYASRSSWWRLLSVVALSLACVTAHLSAFLLLGIAVATTLVWERIKHRLTALRAAVLSLPVLPAVVLWRCAQKGAYDGVWQWGSVKTKLTAAMSVVSTYDHKFDAAITAILVLLIALTLWTGRPTFSPPFTILACVLFAGFLAVPMFGLGGSDLDTRLVIPAYLFLLIGIRFHFSPRWGAVLLSVFLAVQAVRVAMILRAWEECDRLEQRQLAMIASLPLHVRVFPIHVHSDDPEQRKRERHLYHGICLAAVERGAFVESIFGVRGQHSLIVRQANTLGHVTGAGDLPTLNWSRVFGDSDYIWSFRLPEPYRAYLDARLPVAAADGPMRLYRIPHDITSSDNATPIDHRPNTR